MSSTFYVQYKNNGQTKKVIVSEGSILEKTLTGTIVDGRLKLNKRTYTINPNLSTPTPSKNFFNKVDIHNQLGGGGYHSDDLPTTSIHEPSDVHIEPSHTYHYKLDGGLANEKRRKRVIKNKSIKARQ